MKLKNYILFDTAFTEALLYFVKLHLPVRISFPLEKCLKKFQEEETLVKTARDNLVKKFGEVVLNAETKEPEAWDISKSSKENQDAFNKELIELLNMEFDLPVPERISAVLKDFENVSVSSDVLNKMRILIDLKD